MQLTFLEITDIVTLLELLQTSRRKSHWIKMVKVEPFHNSKYMYKQENHRTQARKGYDE